MTTGTMTRRLQVGDSFASLCVPRLAASGTRWVFGASASPPRMLRLPMHETGDWTEHHVEAADARRAGGRGAKADDASWRDDKSKATEALGKRQGCISPSRDLQGTAQGRTLIGRRVLGQRRVPRSVHGAFCRCNSWQWRAKGYGEAACRVSCVVVSFFGDCAAIQGLLLEKEGVALRRVWRPKGRAL
jgi:hypothetical protein